MKKKIALKTKKELPKKHSVRSLVPNITQVTLPTVKDGLEGKNVGRMEKDFNSAHQEIKRIIETWQDMLNSKGSLNITDETAKGFVKVTQEMYHGGKVREQYEKLRSKEKLTTDDHDKMIDVFVDANAVDLGLTEEQKQQFKQWIEETKADDCWEAAEELRDQVVADLSKVNDLWDYQVKKKLLEDYHKVIYVELAGWRVILNAYADYEKKMVEEAGTILP